MVVTMKLKRLGENKLEIILSAAELAAWELCPQQIKQPDPLTQSILARLLHKASQQKRVSGRRGGVCNRDFPGRGSDHLSSDPHCAGSGTAAGVSLWHQ